MRAYIVKRLMLLVPVLFAVTIMTFVLIHSVPVDPAQAYMTASKIPITAVSLKAVRHSMGLDRPLAEQYFQWLSKAVHLDLGTSFATQDPVLVELEHAFPNTLILAAAAVLWLVAISVPLGLLSAVFHGHWIDHSSRIFTFLGSSIPSFWLGFLLIRFFAIRLHLLPIMGRGSWQHLVLPSFTLAIYYAATYTRLLRTGILSNLQQPYVLYANARGLRRKVVVGKHAFRSALLPVVNAFGMSFGYLLAGSVVVEVVFAWPGLGRLITAAIFSRDYPMIQGYVLLMAVVFVLSNLVADLLTSVLDPRIRLGHGGASA